MVTDPQVAVAVAVCACALAAKIASIVRASGMTRRERRTIARLVSTRFAARVDLSVVMLAFPLNRRIAGSAMPRRGVPREAFSDEELCRRDRQLSASAGWVPVRTANARGRLGRGHCRLTAFSRTEHTCPQV
jgi:hypothetical protein